MNILDIQDKLKNFSQEQLIQEMQMPTGQLPQFLLLSEITRRKKMQDSYAQQQDQAQEQTTVAQDAINAAGMPQEAAQQLAGTMAPQTDMAGNTGAMPQQQMMPQAPQPVQGMAGGGIVALKDGGRIVVRDGRRFVVQPDGTLLSEDGSRRVMTPGQNIARDAGMLRDAIGRPEEEFQESFDSRSGLERMEQEQETSRLMSTSPTIRALRLSEIGGNVGDFVNEVGLNAIRQADALVAAGASLGGRTAAGGTAALGALASVLGFPDTGAMLERTANTLAQKRSAMMGRADGERMPFGLPAGRVFTSPEPTPFTVPQEARNLYTQAAVARRLGNTPNDSMLFAEGLPNEQLSQQYSLLPGSTGPSPMAGVTAEMPNLMQSDPRPLDRLREPSPTSPGYFSAPDATLTARPSPLPTFDVSTGVPLSVKEVAAAAFPTQADLDMRYASGGYEANEPFTGEMRVEDERQAALAAPVDAAQDLDAFLSGGVEPLPTGVDAVTGFGVNLADRGIRSVGNLLERALAAGQSNAAAATAGTPPEAQTHAPFPPNMTPAEAQAYSKSAGSTGILGTARNLAEGAADYGITLPGAFLTERLGNTLSSLGLPEFGASQLQTAENARDRAALRGEEREARNVGRDADADFIRFMANPTREGAASVLPGAEPTGATDSASADDTAVTAEDIPPEVQTLDAPSPTARGPSGGGIAGLAGAAGAAPTDFEQELMTMLAAREKRAEQDKWLALAQAGMALMSSSQPTFGGALGEAGASGLGALREGQAGSEADRLALLGQIEQSRMGRERLDLERQALAARIAAGGGRGPTIPQLNAYADYTATTLNALTGGQDPSRLMAAAAAAGDNQRVLRIQTAVAEDAAARTAYNNAMRSVGSAIGGVDPNFLDASANEE